MSEKSRHPPEKEGKEEERKSLSDILKGLLGGGEPAEVAAQPGIIQGVNFGNLVEWVLADRPQVTIETEIEQLKDILEKINAAARELIDVYVKDGLSRIIHPRYGSSVIAVKISQTAELLRIMVREAWMRVYKAIRANEPPETVAKLAYEAELLSRYASLIIVELALKLQTLYYINAPAKVRAPLANVALGYDILD